MFEIKKFLPEKFLTAFLTILLILQFGYDFAYRKGIVDEKIEKIEKKLDKSIQVIQTNSKNISSINVLCNYLGKNLEKEVERIKSDIRRVENHNNDKINTTMLNMNDMNKNIFESLTKLTSIYISSMIAQGKLLQTK